MVTYLTDEIRDATTTLLWNTAPELRAAATELESTGPGTSEEARRSSPDFARQPMGWRNWLASMS